MQKPKSKVGLSRGGQRELSKFVGSELIYDFITHDLDPERRKAVDNFIFENKDAQNDIMKMLNGMQYAERLRETVVSEPILARINEPSTYLAVLLKKTNFQSWPSSVKWALEALVVIGFIIVGSIFVSWDRVAKINIFPERKDVILAEIDKINQVGDPDRLKQLEKTESAEFSEEERTETGLPAKSPVPLPPAKKKNVSDDSDDLKKSVPAVTEMATKPATSPPQPAAPPVTVVAAKSAVSAEAKKPGEGAIYRGGLEVTNLEMIEPKIREKIVELGGRKAGEVELGWKKTASEAYYHFTLPETKYEELLAFLATYGKTKITREKHPRVMPDGIIRLIMTVDEKSP